MNITGDISASETGIYVNGGVGGNVNIDGNVNSGVRIGGTSSIEVTENVNTIYISGSVTNSINIDGSVGGSNTIRAISTGPI